MASECNKLQYEGIEIELSPTNLTKVNATKYNIVLICFFVCRLNYLLNKLSIVKIEVL